MGPAMGLGDVAGGRHGDAAGVGVLDDRDRDGVAMIVHGPERGVGVGVVVVAHGLAVQPAGSRHSPGGARSAVDGGGLVRVLPVAQTGEALVAGADIRGRNGSGGP